MIYCIKNDALTVHIDGKGAELISVIDTKGKEYIWQADKSFWGRHAPILFPVCGRLLNSEYTVGGVKYQMGSHGFARDMEFVKVEQTDNSITLSLSETPDTAKVYPFDFELLVKYTLDKSVLQMDITVKNLGDSVMPYMMGWHPGFNIDGRIDDYRIRFSDGQNTKRNYMKPSLFIDPISVDHPLTDGIYHPTEKEIYGEDTVIFRDAGNTSELILEGKVRLRIKQSDNLPYYAIWKAPKTEAKYICLEPWSDIPSDGITPECFDSRKMSRLKVGEACEYNFSVEFLD